MRSCHSHRLDSCHPDLQDGPEVRNGEIRVSVSETSASRLAATLVLMASNVYYSGRQSDAYTESLECPDRRAVPLTLWLKQ